MVYLQGEFIAKPGHDRFASVAKLAAPVPFAFVLLGRGLDRGQPGARLCQIPAQARLCALVRGYFSRAAPVQAVRALVMRKSLLQILDCLPRAVLGIGQLTRSANDYQVIGVKFVEALQRGHEPTFGALLCPLSAVAHFGASLVLVHAAAANFAACWLTAFTKRAASGPDGCRCSFCALSFIGVHPSSFGSDCGLKVGR
ncbi:MAG: hypothetical protein U1F26_01490 [Lysobacterales bacterium]